VEMLFGSFRLTQSSIFLLQKYEFCLAIGEPKVAWVNVPFLPGIEQDITAFQGGTVEDGKKKWNRSSLYFKLPKGKRVIADGGLLGEPSKILVKSPDHPKEMRDYIGRVLARQESFHTRLKNFNILGQRFRHGASTQHKMDLHKMAVESVAVIIQYDYENGHPPFDV